MGTGGAMTFRLMSPQPPIVVEPASMIVRITCFRFALEMPWIWKAWRVVMRRSRWPKRSQRSSRTR